MSEGPQVRLRAEWLRTWLAGRTVLRALSPKPELAEFCAAIQGRRVDDVACRGKNLFILFEGDWILHNHLLMRGRWRKHRGSFLFPPDDAWLLLDLGAETICNHRGQMLKAIRAREWPEILERIGPDAMDLSVSDERLAARLSATPLAVAEALLDQRCISGIGNLARSEALFLARVLPGRNASRLSPGEVLGVIRCARRVLADSYAAGGRWVHRVYHRAGEPCIRCGSPVRRARLPPSHRSIYFCARCQR
jgi:endonuclease-8